MTRPLTDIAPLEVFAAELDLAHPGQYPDSVRWIAVANHIPNAQNLSREELGAIICVRHDIGHIDPVTYRGPWGSMPLVARQDPVDLTPSRENPISSLADRLAEQRRDAAASAALINSGVLVRVTRDEIAHQCARTDLTCGVGWSADQRAEAQENLRKLIYNLIIRELNAMTVTALVMTLNTKDTE